MRYATIALLALPALLNAQPQHAPSLDSLARAVDVGITRYADRREAVAVGYHRIGPVFPGMGEHWLNIGVLLDNVIDATRPTLLIYANIGDQPRLLGAGFATTTDQSRTSADVPGWPDAWHEHSGLLVDESGVKPSTNRGSGTHVWVLHVWTKLANPDGIFHADNWALPFARLGYAMPPGVDADAARALALLDGGDRYLRDVLGDAGLRSAENAASVDAVIARHRANAETAVGAGMSGATLAQLKEVWRELRAALHERLGPRVDPLLEPPHDAHHHPAGGS